MSDKIWRDAPLGIKSGDLGSWQRWMNEAVEYQNPNVGDVIPYSYKGGLAVGYRFEGYNRNGNAIGTRVEEIAQIMGMDAHDMDDFNDEPTTPSRSYSGGYKKHPSSLANELGLGDSHIEGQGVYLCDGVWI